MHIGYWWVSQKERDHCEDQDIGGWQWRLVAKITGGAAPENSIFFINWGMATDIKLKNYILYKYKERTKEKRTHYIICYR
jgi:hypothetical protein